MNDVQRDHAPALTVGVLGPFQVHRDGSWAAPPTRQVAKVGTLLAGWPGELVERDRIVFGMWGEHPPATAANTLQVHVSHLRRLVGKDAVRSQGAHYLLDVDAESVDAEAFAGLVRQASIHRQQGDVARATTLLVDSLAMWWPEFPVNAIRLWDTRTTWLHLEPADDQWDFSTLDAHLGKAAGEGVDDVTLVLASTPRWAAVRETAEDAPWLGPGSASPPADIEQWREFVRTVAVRYAGRIDHYEIGNEPNLLTFWNGTVAQFADLVRVAAEEIAAADPAATVIVNGGLVRRPGDLDALDTWLAPVAGSALIDAVSVHFYPKAANLPQLPDLLAAARDRLAAGGFGAVPLWVTEVNVQDGSSMAGPDQESAVDDLTAQVEEAGFDRAYWYAWTDLGPLNLIQLAPGTVGARALAAG